MELALIGKFILKHWKAALIALAVIVFILFVVTDTGRRREAEKQAKDAQIEANRQAGRAEGLEIIINSNSQAEAVERQKETANRQAENSNAAVNRANGIRHGNFNNSSLEAAEKARCEAYPEACK